jgi:hypothetical protein
MIRRRLTTAAMYVGLAVLGAMIFGQCTDDAPKPMSHAVLIPSISFERPLPTTTLPDAPSSTTSAPLRATTTQRASRSSSAPRQTTTSTSAPATVGEYGLPTQLRRIGGCESTGRPDGPLVWTAHNRKSGASGAFQYLRSTWNHFAGFLDAELAPPSVQLDRALSDYRRSGTTPWAASARCWR